MAVQIPASVFAKIVEREDDAGDLLNDGGKYSRWFCASRDGGLWLMDMGFYRSSDYPGPFCVVYVGGLFPRYDKVTGEFIKSSIGPFDFTGEPDPKVIEKYHGEKVEIVGD